MLRRDVEVAGPAEGRDGPLGMSGSSALPCQPFLCSISGTPLALMVLASSGVGLKRLPASDFGDLLQCLVIDGHRLALIINLHIAVGGAERDCRDLYALFFGGAGGGVGIPGLIRVGRYRLLAV